MPVSIQDPINSSIANGVTTIFPYQFLIPEAGAIAVEIDGVIVTTGFTISGVGNPSGGNITFAVAPANGSSVVRYRDLDAKRDFDWTEGGDLLAATHDANDDYAIMLIQQVLEQIGRAPKVARGDTSSGNIPRLADRTSRYWAWDANGALIASSGTGTDAGLRQDLAAAAGGSLVSFIQNAAGAVLRNMLSKVRGFRIDVEDFGVLPSNSAAANDAALLNAIAACPEGDCLQFGFGRYAFTRIDVNKRIGLMGRGWWLVLNPVFGGAAWDATQCGGTVLVISATTGVGVEVSSHGSSPNGLRAEDLLIVGPGSGTSTGFQVGHANGEGASEPIVRNVGVVNFSVGFDAMFCNEGTFGVRVRGCATGIKLEHDANNNEFIGWEVQKSTVIAVDCVNSKGNTWVGGLTQGCTGKGWKFSSNSYTNKLLNVWNENLTITKQVECENGSTHLTIDGGQFTDGLIDIDAQNCAVRNPQYSGNCSMVTGANSIGFILEGATPPGGWTQLAVATSVTNDGVNTNSVKTGETNFMASNGAAAQFVAADSTPVSTVAVQCWPIAALSGAAEAGLVVVTGTKEGSSTIYFSDLVKFHVGIGAGAVAGFTQELNAPAARTYGITGGFLTVTMAADTYLVSQGGFTVRGD